MSLETDKAKELQNKFSIIRITFLFAEHTVSCLTMIANRGLVHAHIDMMKRLVDFAALENPTKEQKTDHKLIRDLERIQVDQAKAAVDSAAIIYVKGSVPGIVVF